MTFYYHKILNRSKYFIMGESIPLTEAEIVESNQ